MKIKVSEATPLQLDWLVAKCEGENGILHDDGITRCIVVVAASGVYRGTWRPTDNWSQGGPIIEQERIGTSMTWSGTCWLASAHGIDAEVFSGPTPLVAAMRCYCHAKLGDEVEIPEEL